MSNRYCLYKYNNLLLMLSHTNRTNIIYNRNILKAAVFCTFSCFNEFGIDDTIIFYDTKLQSTYLVYLAMVL